MTVRARWFLAFAAVVLVANLWAPIARADAGGHEDPIVAALLALAFRFFLFWAANAIGLALIVTNTIVPPLLKWSFARAARMKGPRVAS